jgi:hypothetical protein
MTVKELLAGLVLEAGAVGFCILSEIAARRVLLDDPRLTTDTDRAADMPDPASLADGEHVMASTRSA